jgi:hypothetical protein
LDNKTYPSSLSNLHYYFRTYRQINFQFERQQDGSFIAFSTDFQYGSIITSAPSKELLDDKVKDAILTAFEVPSSYAKEAAVKRQGEEGYAFA